MTTVLHLTFKRDQLRADIIADAQNDDGWEDGDLYEVVVDPDEITVEGTPEGIRWLYDWLEWVEDEHRMEGAYGYADVSSEMAETVWDVISPDPPERQRPRRI